MDKRAARRDDLIDVRHAARLAGRHPETIRRWVWSGRLRAERHGRQLLVAESEVRSLVGVNGALSTLRDWADRARAMRASTPATKSGTSAADLVLEDRSLRSTEAAARARR